MSGLVSGRLAWRPLLLPAIVLTAAVAVGILIARQASAPGDLQALIYFWLVPLGLTAALLSVAGIVGRTHDDNPTAAPTQALGSGLALAVGLLSGIVATPILGLTYAPVTYLHATGTSQLQLSAAAEYQPDPTAPTKCRSLGDATAAGEVVVTTAGLFRGEHVIATLGRSLEGVLDTITIELDGSGDIPIVWTGQASVETHDADGRSGRATFDGLVGTNIAVRGLPLGQSEGSLGDWPARISGTLTWTCGSWVATPA